MVNGFKSQSRWRVWSTHSEIIGVKYGKYLLCLFNTLSKWPQSYRKRISKTLLDKGGGTSDKNLLLTQCCFLPFQKQILASEVDSIVFEKHFYRF